MVKRIVCKRVNAGILWSDQVEPGWVSRIDLVKFDMTYSGYCFLGQLFGNFKTGLNHLPSGTKAYEYGFDTEFKNPAVTFQLLNKEWKKKIVWRKFLKLLRLRR